MNCKKTVAGLLAVALLAGLSFVAVAKDKLEGKAKITKAEAVKIALERFPDGKVADSELEEENGKLIWSLDLQRPGTKDITEVQIDALTGKIVDVATEDPAAQAKEKAEKEKEAKEKK